MSLLIQIGILAVIFIAFCVFFFSERNKQRLHERFQRTIKKVEVDGEEVYLKKTGLFVKDWQRVYPPVTEDGTKWLWKEAVFGSKQNMIRSLVYLLLVLIAIFAFYEYANSVTAFINQPEINACIVRAGYNITTGASAFFGG